MNINKKLSFLLSVLVLHNATAMDPDCIYRQHKNGSWGIGSNPSHSPPLAWADIAQFNDNIFDLEEKNLSLSQFIQQLDKSTKMTPQELDKLQSLLDQNVDINTINTTFYTLVSSGKVEGVKKLLFNGSVDVKQDDFHSTHTPLGIAATHGYVEIVQLLLQHGAHVNANNRLNRTPLYLAAKNGHIEIAKLLLANGADVYQIQAIQ